MSDVLSFNPNRALTANIDAAAAARAFFYDAGTTTLRTVYADSELTIPHASPLVANAAGIFPAVYVDGASVKVVAQDAAGATLYTLDPCVKVAATGATAAQVSFAPSTAAPYANVQAAIDDLASLRNSTGADRIVNGDFGIWQRGTSTTASGYGAADRWRNRAVGGTVTQQRGTPSPGAVAGAVTINYFLRQSVTGQTLPSHIAATRQSIEGVRSYAGQTITVLGFARRSAGTSGDMAVGAIQDFGTGGTVSLAETINATVVTLGTGFAPFAVTLNIPAISGKLIGSNNDDCLHVEFWASAGSDYNGATGSLGLQTVTVDLWGIHIRVGTWAADDALLYRPRDPGTELALCQRYYEAGSYAEYSGVSAASIVASFLTNVNFSVAKRAVPSISGTNDMGTFSATNISTSGAAIGRSTAVARRDNTGTFTADAEL